MPTIDDLPNELLDEIFAYLYPRFSVRIPAIPMPKGRLVNGVCRRWNRPLLTSRLSSLEWGLPGHVNLQLECTRLLSLIGYVEDLKNFKGHASLRELGLTCDYMSNEVPSYSFILSSCPRLTRLTLNAPLSIFFDNANIAALMSLCPCLTHLDLDLTIDVNVNEKMTRMINDRNSDCQGLVNLKRLVMTVSIDDDDDLYNQFDLASLFSLFKAPFLEHLKLGHWFGSAQDQSKVFSLFPRVRSIELDGFLFPHNMRVYDHVTDLKFVYGNVNLLSILNHFPKVTSLDCKITSRNCNGFIQEVGLYCPQLVKFILVEDGSGEDPIIPDFGNVTFPLLTSILLHGNFMFNESFTRFVTRHPKLESLQFHSRGKFQEDLTVTDSKMIQWPKLITLTLFRISPESTIPRLHWFLKNSPNLVRLTFDMGGYEPNGTESEIAFYCPNLKFLNYTGNVSGESLRRWTRTGNWTRTLKNLRIKINFKPFDLVLLFQFLGTLSSTNGVAVTLIQPVGQVPEPKEKYLDQCPEEWKPIVKEYCDCLELWHTDPYVNPKAVFKKVVPYSGARIVSNFGTF